MHLPGVLHLPGLLAPGICERWRTAAELRIEAAHATQRDAPDWSPSSSSLRLRAVPEIGIETLRAALGGEPLQRACEALGSALAFDLDECWLRHQYAPFHAPAPHRPHAWHQDGALRFDFVAWPCAPWPADALLEMVTCWVALSPCGVDAPGLEILARPIDALLAPAELGDAELRARFAGHEFVRPEFAAGEALLFGGGALHRTHVDAAMRRDRTSLELRFFAADRLPARLAMDRFSRLPACVPRSVP